MEEKVPGKSKLYPQFLAAGSATLGSFAFGMVLGWSSPVELKVDDAFDFPVTDDDFSWVGSVVPLGAAIACIPTGYFLDFIGRKNTMLYISIPFLIGWAFILWPAAVEMLIVGRFITGFCGAIFCVASPLYIAEIAEPKYRGALTSFYQLLLSLGVEAAYIIGAYTSVFWFSVVCALIPIIFVACFIFMPESPIYLVKINRIEDAKKSLLWFRGPNYNVDQDLDKIRFNNEESSKDVSLLDLFKDRVARKGLLIFLGLMAAQQLAGNNAVVFYTNAIFEDTGVGLDPKISTIILGGVVMFALVPSAAIIDRVGRKICLIISFIGAAISITILGFYFLFQEELSSQGWLPLTSLVLYQISFSIGAGPVAWVIGAEIFAPQVKGRANGIGAMTNWALAFLVTKVYAQISEAVGIWTTYWFFGLCCVLGALHSYFFVPETKGKSIEEILQEL